ncbi:MAG: GGDEF domain-containing protein [Spirochaetes bacterium]|nr:GGDEF domain-containing protein [Spirochaetota bacterium]MBN2769266.1 GGDEF domain-containing protein [Spirochaetota bacterium]
MIRTKLYISLTIIILMFGFILTTLSSFFVSRHSLRSQITSNEIPLTTSTIYSEIKSDLLASKYISSTMANDIFLKEWLLSGEKELNRVEYYLEQYVQNLGLSSAFVISENSKKYYSHAGILKTVSLEDPRDNWYYNLKKNSNSFDINIASDAANNNTHSIFFNQKMFDKKGKFIGVTGVGVPVETVSQVIDYYHNKYGKNIYLSDTKGRVVLYSSKTGLLGAKIGSIPGLLGKEKLILSKSPQSFMVENHGEIIHINSRYIPELNWILIVEQIENNITANIKISLYINIAVSILICTIILMIMLFLMSRYNRKMRLLATTDKLTDTYNRTAFDLYIEIMRKESIRSKQPFALSILDLDFFKGINDTYGHTAGDQVLRKSTEIIKASIRESDILFRWGGEEFLILLRNCPLKEAVEILDKIRKTINKTIFYFNNTPITITISAGVTVYQDTEDIDATINRADKLLYNAKHSGRNKTSY